MRMLVFVCGFAALVFGGYWLGVAYLVPAWLNTQIARHPNLDGQLQKVTGFPSRFDLVLENPVWRDATANALWRSARVNAQISSLAPNRLRLSFPMPHYVAIAGEEMRIDSDSFGADIVLAPDLALVWAEADMADLDLLPPVIIENITQLRARLTAQAGAQYALALDGRDIMLARAFLASIGPESGLSGTVSQLMLDADLAFDRPLTLATAAPDLREIEIRSASLSWDDMLMRLSGNVQRDGAGMLHGDLVLVLSNFAPLPRALIAFGVITPEIGGFLAMFLAGQADPVTGEAALPLAMRNSVLSLGPFALVQVPPL